MAQIKLIPIIEHGSGEELGITVIEFGDPNSENKAYIQGSLHGNELMGSVVILELAERLASLESHLNGFIRLVPSCNPVGIATKVFNAQVGRVNLTDFEDWNRIFHRLVKKVETEDSFDYEVEVRLPSPEFRERWQLITKISNEEEITISLRAFCYHYGTQNLLEIKQGLEAILLEALTGLHNQRIPYCFSSSELLAFELEKLSFGADTVIDLHTNSGEGEFYTYFFEWQQKSLPYLGVSCGLKMLESKSKALDECSGQGWSALWRLFNDDEVLCARFPEFYPPSEFWTLELGSSNDVNPSSVQCYSDKIMNYLSYRRFIPERSDALTQHIYVSRENFNSSNIADTRYYAPCSGFFYPSVKSGTIVEIGQEIGRVLSLSKLKKYANQNEFPEKLNQSLSVKIYAREKAFVLNMIDSPMVFQGMTLFTVVEDFETWIPT